MFSVKCSIKCAVVNVPSKACSIKGTMLSGNTSPVFADSCKASKESVTPM